MNSSTSTKVHEKKIDGETILSPCSLSLAPSFQRIVWFGSELIRGSWTVYTDMLVPSQSEMTYVGDSRRTEDVEVSYCTALSFV